MAIAAIKDAGGAGVPTIKPWHTDDGILVVGLFDFLSSPDSLDW
jgi:hypothetical protein